MDPPGFFRLHSVGRASLSIVLRPRGGDWLADDIRTLSRAGVRVLVSMLTPEEEEELELVREGECCKAVNIEFLSVPVADLGTPKDLQRFESAVARVLDAFKRRRSVAVHCRQSIGRSAMFTCATLVALGFPLDKALTTTSRARGVPVPETPQQRLWLEQNAQRFGRSDAVD
jgi:protein-tyrosine phosphatase